MKANDHIIPQSGVVPFRRSRRGFEVLLITSRGAGRWLVPKGLIEPDMSAAQSALQEAWEEAGLRGKVLKPALGVWSYEKWGAVCEVKTFLMKVRKVERRWPEEDRRRAWYRLDAALDRVSHKQLRRLLARLPRHIA